jgi:ABC-type glycerol-3-phosphate transport system permease component
VDFVFYHHAADFAGIPFIINVGLLRKRSEKQKKENNMNNKIAVRRPKQGLLQSQRFLDRAGKTCVYIVITGLSIVYLIPFVWLVSSSLKTDAQIFAMPPKWIPQPAEWKNYLSVMSQVPFFRFVYNTLFIAVLVMAANIFVSAMVAYAFARLRARGKTILFMLLLSTMMLPGQVTMIPMFILFSNLRWVNTPLPLIVPSFFGGSALYVFLIRQFFSSVPMSLDEAAKIEGANHFTIFTKVLLPMSRPVLITIAVFSFVGSWNDFMGPLIYLSRTDTFTLALGMNLFKSQYTTNWNFTMAYNVMMIVPIIGIFFFAQKSFIQGIVITGLK